MIDISLRECPFCGCPAEIVDAEPYEWDPNEPVKAIRCSNEFGCPGYSVKLTFQVNCEASEAIARGSWNTRRRKNKFLFDENKDGDKSTKGGNNGD